MDKQAEPNFERSPTGVPFDETDVSLRAYLAQLSVERLQQYDSKWSDQQVIDWDGNFRFDGELMLVCCERDVDVKEYRAVLEEHLSLRKINAVADKDGGR